MPATPSLQLGPPRACRLRCRSSASRDPHLVPHRMPSFRLGRARRRSTSRWASTPQASQLWKPCLGCVPRAPLPPAFSRTLPVHAVCTGTALSPPGPHLVPHRMPSLRLGSTRRRSTGRCVSTRPPSQTWRTCFRCAQRLPAAFGWTAPRACAAACAAATPRPPAPGPHLVPHRMLSFRLGRKRRRSTSR